jgi:hypothetical protein
VLGLRMSARSQVTLCAQDGGVAEDVTVDQSGSPDRLCWRRLVSILYGEAQHDVMFVTGYRLD